METKLVIMTVKDIIETYGIERDAVYALLNIRGCPLITGGKNRKYRVEKSAFEDWLKNGVS